MLLELCNLLSADVKIVRKILIASPAGLKHDQYIIRDSMQDCKHVKVILVLCN